MAVFTVQPETLRQKARQLESQAEQYDSMRNKLLNTATSMGAAYQSEDNKKYVARITDFCQQMREVSEKMRNGARVLMSQADGYEQTQSRNASDASKLPG